MDPGPARPVTPAHEVALPKRAAVVGVVVVGLAVVAALVAEAARLGLQ